MIPEDHRSYTKKYLFFCFIGVTLILILFFLWSGSENEENIVEVNACDEDCQLFYAVSKNSDPDFCKNIQDSQQKNECYRITAINTTEVSLCSNITERPVEESCISSVAYFKRDDNICNLIKNTKNEECIKHVQEAKNLDYSIQATESGNIQLCEIITDKWEKIGCIADVAKKLNDPKICELIIDRYKQKDCIEWVNHKGIDPSTQSYEDGKLI